MAKAKIQAKRTGIVQRASNARGRHGSKVVRVAKAVRPTDEAAPTQRLSRNKPAVPVKRDAASKRGDANLSKSAAAAEGLATSKAGSAAKAGSAPKFDIDDARLPSWISEAALGSGGFPYDKKLKRNVYEEELRVLQIELRKLQSSIQAQGRRLVCLFEGRDAAGKGSAISRMMAHLNPRAARAIALSKPSEAEKGQWYFQRYITHLPAAGNILLFDRSWYNRAGVERVMGFCAPDQLADFLREVPPFEGMLVRDDMHVFKFYLDIGREMQLKRFHARRHDPLKLWKVTDIDLAAIGKWDEYTRAKEDMFRFTHTAASPWTVIRANDKRRTRLEVMRTVLAALDYDDKDAAAVGEPDPLIVGSGPGFFYGAAGGGGGAK